MATIYEVRIPVVVCAALVILSACDTNDGRTMATPVFPPPTTTIPVDSTVVAESADNLAALTAPMTLTAPWLDGDSIPIEFTCDGVDASPELIWTNVPAGATELAVVMTDLDANSFVHWSIAAIDPTLTSLERGSLPATVALYPTSWGSTGWQGPCPPAGELHTYQLTLYALAAQPELPIGVTADEVVSSLSELAIASATVSGTYERSPAVSATSET